MTQMLDKSLAGFSVSFFTYHFQPCSELLACAKLIERPQDGKAMFRMFFLRTSKGFIEVEPTEFFAHLSTPPTR